VVISDTVVVTAGHCVFAALGNMFQPGFTVEVRRRDAKPTAIIAKPLSASSQMDVGTFSGNFRSLPKVHFLTGPYELYDAVEHAPYLITCGYPMGGDLYCKRTIYLGPREFSWMILGQLIPGMSGGPVMLPDGTAIAVNSAVEGPDSRIAPIINIPMVAPK